MLSIKDPENASFAKCFPFFSTDIGQYTGEYASSLVDFLEEDEKDSAGNNQESNRPTESSHKSHLRLEKESEKYYGNGNRRR